MAAPVPAKAAAIVVKVVRREVQSATVQLHRDGRLVASEKVEGTRQSVRFTNLIGDTYAVSVVAPKAVGSYTVVTTRSPSRTIVLGITAVHADKSRAVRGVFTPGRPLVLRATDAAGIHYQLELPADALSSATTIEMTPLTGMPGPGLSNGKGVELEPSGLKLRASAMLTVDGGTFKHLPYLFYYEPLTAGWVPQIPLPEFAAERDRHGRAYAITHFSKYHEYKISDCAAVPECAIDSTGKDNVIWPGDVLPGEANAAAQFYQQIGDLGDSAVWAALNYIDSHRDVMEQIRDPFDNKVAAATREALTKLASANAANACSHGPDEASFYLAQLTADLAAHVNHQTGYSVKGAALRCIPVFRQYGNADCHDGAEHQDAAQRRIGEHRLYFAIYMADRAAMSIPLGRKIYDEDVAECTGYHTDAVYHDPIHPEVEITLVHAFTCSTLLRRSHWAGLGWRLDHEQPEPLDFTITEGSRFDWLSPYSTFLQFGDQFADLDIENWATAEIPHTMTFHLQIVASSNNDFVAPKDNAVPANIVYGVKDVEDQTCLPLTYPRTGWFSPDGLRHLGAGETVGEPAHNSDRQIDIGGRG
jgi:hypothetical protein